MNEYQRICLVHYHEIGLKGHNRSSFEMRLLRNLEGLLKAFPLVAIHRISGRLLIFIKEGTSYEVACEIADTVARIPGVARVSSGYKCERELDEMYETAELAIRDAGPFDSFKVAARRNHTDFPIDSMELNQLVGSHLCAVYPEKQVKMKNPDLRVCVEVVEGSTYVYARSITGIGGLPVGSSGRVMCLLSSGIDSPVALWKMARRGAVCLGVHFSGRPQTADTSEYLVDDIAHVLEKTGCIARVYVVPFGDYQREIAGAVPPELRVIMYRRLMFKVAAALCGREKAKALVTGESLGQVASQTLENISVTDAAVDMPIFRPLIGSDKLDIINLAQELGTYEISSQDAPDCCTLFMPRNPETHAKLHPVLAIEAQLPLETWIAELVEKAEIHDYRCSSYRPKKRSKPSVPVETTIANPDTGLGEGL
ncbi:MAG: tRNA uracil 4-sulfurtransferase ThiI [Raoultibacter sp.]